MAQNYTWPSVSVNATNPSVGTNGATAPTSSTEIGGIYSGSGDLVPVSVDAYGNINVNSTSVGTGNVNITEVLGAAPSATNPLATEIAYSGSYIDPRQIRALTSSDVVTADQGGTWNITNISGTISLPTGAATSANQTNASQKTQIVDGSGNVIASTTNALNVAVQGTTPVSGTVAISQTTPGTTNGVQVNAALPAGSNTIGAVTQASGPWSQNLTEVGGSSVALGQTTMSASIPVAIASDQTAIPASMSGTWSVSLTGTAISNAPLYNLYSSTNVTTSAYVQLIASTTGATNTIHIFDSSGQAMILGLGASGSEVATLYVPPGGDTYTLYIPTGTRIAYKALTGTASTGYLLMSFLH